MAEYTGFADNPDWLPRFTSYVTCFYRPPELWNASEKDLRKHLAPSVDIWSFGCVLYEVVVGEVLTGPSTQTCKAAVQTWHQSWPVLRTSRYPCPGPGRIARNFHKPTEQIRRRLQKADRDWQKFIVQALSPEPSARTELPRGIRKQQRVFKQSERGSFCCCSVFTEP